MLLGLALTFGVTACSTPATEPETVEEAPVEDVADEAPVEDVADEASVEDVADEAPVEAEAEEDADAAEAVPCSPRDEGAEVEIRIENEGPFTVFVNWIDFDCNAVEVTVLAPDDVHYETTTVGHVFTAGGHGYDHGTYVVPAGGGTWTITGPTDYPGDDSGGGAP